MLHRRPQETGSPPSERHTSADTKTVLRVLYGSSPLFTEHSCQRQYASSPIHFPDVERYCLQRPLWHAAPLHRINLCTNAPWQPSILSRAAVHLRQQKTRLYCRIRTFRQQWWLNRFSHTGYRPDPGCRTQQQSPIVGRTAVFFWSYPCHTPGRRCLTVHAGIQALRRCVYSIVCFPSSFFYCP